MPSDKDAELLREVARRQELRGSIYTSEHLRRIADRLEAHKAELLRVAERAYDRGWGAARAFAFGNTHAYTRGKRDLAALLGEREES